MYISCFSSIYTLVFWILTQIAIYTFFQFHKVLDLSPFLNFDFFLDILDVWFVNTVRNVFVLLQIVMKRNYVMTFTVTFILRLVFFFSVGQEISFPTFPNQGNAEISNVFLPEKHVGKNKKRKKRWLSTNVHFFLLFASLVLWFHFCSIDASVTFRCCVEDKGFLFLRTERGAGFSRILLSDDTQTVIHKLISPCLTFLQIEFTKYM